MWDQLTPGDIEHARTELDARRAEMFARHAAELQTLDADHAELEGLEQAIAAFARKFSLGKAAVVQLEDERESRLHSHG